LDTSRPTYTHLPFSVTPSVCPLKYSITHTDIFSSDADTAIESYDENTFTFTWNYDALDDGPIRPVKQNQVITVKAESMTKYRTIPVEPTKSDENDFTLILLDPCLDEVYSTVIATDQVNPNPNFYDNKPIRFTYNPFTTTPLFCEPLLRVRCVNIVKPPNANEAILCENLDLNDQLVV